MTEEKQRGKRNERRVPPPKMRVTERDKRVIETIYHYRVLTQTQIERLLFTDNHRSIPQNRLRLLYDNEYIQRRFLPSIGGVVTSPVLYLLDKRGSEFLLKNGYDEVRWQPGDNRVGYEHLEHLLAINMFRVELALACQGHSEYTLTIWIDDTCLKQDYDNVAIPDRTKPIAVIPDGYFAITVPKGITHFFLELDRGTMSSKRFKQKTQAYMMYSQAGLSQKRFGTSKFRVLTVTESVRRGENLKAATEEVGGRNRFWFGVLADLTADEILTETIWNVAGRTQKVSLLG